ncbi:beta-D-xylosidase 1-like isoform X2 [Haliotis rubra]|uniref:beta-D-xylosidase 1-like isoform X2 n=1 Tax=Haliotis rubra TaxID=36100 RepID=UPI001EE61ACE|nr:beta-D-xylosidase 1-like isoform X2 [Haliotis rubra]
MNGVIYVYVLIFQCLFVLGDYPFRNTSLPWDVRVEDLVGRLTLDEMQEQMARGGHGNFGGPAPPIPRLGIGPYSWNTECLRGDVGAGNATSFPQALGLAAAFSKDLMYRVAEATSVEVRGKYNDYISKKEYGDHKGISCFSPFMNIMRDPRWGRNQEVYGEDPYMTGVLAAMSVKGLQGNDSRFIRTNSGCKVFAAYAGPDSIPVSRHNFSAVVSVRDFRTTFLPAFRACVKAGTYNIMCGYNSFNGTPSCANRWLLTDVLRNELNFTGYVISDQGAIERIMTTHHYLDNGVDIAAASVNAGVNLELAENLRQPFFTLITEAVKQGKLTEDLIRERVKPLFYTRMRLGEFDPPESNPYTELNTSTIESESHKALAVEAAMKTYVLLKNVNSFLPLTKKYNSIGVVGPIANDKVNIFGDYSPDSDPRFTMTALDGIKQLSSNVQYGAGCSNTSCTNYNSSAVHDAVSGKDLVFVCLGTGQEIESEARDRPNIELPAGQAELLQDSLKFSGNTPVVLLMFNAGPLNITMADASPQVAAILECFFPAQATGEALRRVLTMDGPGSVPAARLPYTWPKSLDGFPAMTNYSMAGRTYRYYEDDPLYPFGYGLSYTEFSYSRLQYANVIKAGEDVEVSILLQNTGKYEGDEVVQVYISWGSPSVPIPRRQLVAFERVTIAANAFQVVNVTVSAESMAVWVDNSGWVIEPGYMQMFAGGQQPGQQKSAASQVLEGRFKVEGSKYLGVY